MTIQIRGADSVPLELFPENEEQEIVQNILCILWTLNGSCPNLREYGIDPEVYHKPIPIARAAYTVAITRQIQEYEPRVTLERVDYEVDPKEPEVLIPVLEVTINESDE
jgi:phage baseplate assembly protein W